MKNLTKRVFLDSLPSDDHRAMARRVMNQLGGWVDFRDSARDISEHGAMGGFPGFCYYSDTVGFAERNKSLILRILTQEADEAGLHGPYSMVSEWRIWRDRSPRMSPDRIADALYNPLSEDRDDVMNALAWGMLESAAYWFELASEEEG